MADVEGNLSVKKKTEDDENLFFKALPNRFWLASKNCLWFNKVVHDRSSIKWTSWKGNVRYVSQSRLDVRFAKKIYLEIVIGQQMKEQEHDQNY